MVDVYCAAGGQGGRGLKGDLGTESLSAGDPPVLHLGAHAQHSVLLRVTTTTTMVVVVVVVGSKG